MIIIIIIIIIVIIKVTFWRDHSKTFILGLLF